MTKKPVVLITGASVGIGAAVAHRFSKAGYSLALCARRLDLLEKLKSELGEAEIFPVDVTSSEKVAEMVEKIEKDLGPISILVNNAGLAAGLEPAYEGRLEEWDRCVDVNIKGLLYVTRCVLTHMVKRNCGHIINLGSIAGSYPYPGGNVYGATKAFVNQFSLNLRADLLGTKVRVSCIEPGMVSGTEFSVVRFRGDQERAKKLYENLEALEADDVAEVIFFCTSVPEHVNLNIIEMMPVCQAAGPLAFHKRT